MRALSTFFQQGYDLMQDLEPYLKQVSTQVSNCHPWLTVGRFGGLEDIHHFFHFLSLLGHIMTPYKDTIVLQLISLVKQVD